MFRLKLTAYIGLTIVATFCVGQYH